MTQEYSFDVVSQFEWQELVNAVNQTSREMRTRYDLKNAKGSILLEKERLVLTCENEFVLGSIRDVLESKVVRRGLSLKILRYGKVEPAAGGSVRQVVNLQQGIPAELAREIVALIKKHNPKVGSQIQGDAVRVSGKSKDELQGVIRLLRERDFPVALQFINYR